MRSKKKKERKNEKKKPKQQISQNDYHPSSFVYLMHFERPQIYRLYCTSLNVAFFLLSPLSFDSISQPLLVPLSLTDAVFFSFSTFLFLFALLKGATFIFCKISEES